MKLYRWVCHIKRLLKNDFRLSWTVKSLPTLRKLEVLKCIIMHSLWQLAETGSRSLSSVNIIHVLQVHSWSNRHIVPPCNKAGISNFCLEFQKLRKFPDFFKTLLLLQFLFDHSEIYTGETRHIVPPYNKAGISNFYLEFQKLKKNCRNSRFLQNATPPSVHIRSF